MGFRSVMITEDADPGFFPPWFVAKYERQFYMPGDDGGPMSSKFEIKEYDLPELYADIQRLLKPSENSLGNESFILVWLHECGGITRVEIHPAVIYFMHPTDFEVSDEVLHHYCYHCSPASRFII